MVIEKTLIYEIFEEHLGEGHRISLVRVNEDELLVECTPCDTSLLTVKKDSNPEAIVWTDEGDCSSAVIGSLVVQVSPGATEGFSWIGHIAEDGEFFGPIVRRDTMEECKAAIISEYRNWIIARTLDLKTLGIHDSSEKA